MTRQWGMWHFTPSALERRPDLYQIGWDTIHSTADVLDWIVHLEGREGGAPIAAFKDVLGLRFGGCYREIDGPALARAYARAHR